MPEVAFVCADWYGAGMLVPIGCNGTLFDAPDKTRAFPAAVAEDAGRISAEAAGGCMNCRACPTTCGWVVGEFIETGLA